MDLRWRRLRAALAAARAHHPPIEDNAEARLDAVLRRLPALVWSTDGALRVTSVRGGAVLPAGVDGGSVVGRTLAEVLGDRGGSALDAHRRARLGRPAEFELAWRGRLFQGHAEPWPPGRGGEGEGTLAVLLDTTEQREAEERLLHAVMHDPVTGLPNRRLFLERVWQTMGRGRRHSGHGFGILLLDLDGFAAVKDGLGHLAGDEFLSAVAGRLIPCVRPQDTLAHLGGEQFSILVDDVVEASDLLRVAGRVRRALSRPVTVGGQDVFTSATIGIAPGSSAYRAPEEILRDAHTAMHRARLQGAGAFQLFDDGMHERAVARLLLETELRRAVERGEFRLHYQPIMSLQSGRLIAFEALVRWEHPRRGLLAPHDFLGLAEETGLILPVGRWVLREGCRQMRAWRHQVPTAELPRMSLNLSGRQLAEGDLIEEVDGTLRGAGLAGHEVDLEVTENVIMQDTDSTRGCLAGLRALELGVSIDDFGTGHSSLSHLDRLPVDTLKIDRSFLAGGHGRPHKTEIIRTIVALGHDLGLEVVAEGIETPAQLAELREMGCDHGQGYLFSRPVDAVAAGAMLAA
jgi:diguanylate cyclase (GGDEF)-like protein